MVVQASMAAKRSAKSDEELSAKVRAAIRSKRFQGCLRPLYEATGSVRVLLQPAVLGAAAASPYFTLHYFLS
jgi:hypothetical protein